MEYNEKQIQILDVAERLFADNGFDGTSVRDIAKEADVNVAMISYYFGSKEKLLEAIFTKRSEFIKLQIENLLENHTLTPVQKINTLIDVCIEKVLNQQSFHKLMVCLQVTEKDGNIFDALYEAKKRNHDLIKKLLAEGQKAGEFKKNIDIPLMMSTLFGTAHHFITSQRFYKDVHGLEALDAEAYKLHVKKKLGHHIKSLFKSILTYEA